MPPGLNIKHKDLFMKSQTTNKQTDWFAKYQESKMNALNPPGLDKLPSLCLLADKEKKVVNKSGLTKEEEIQIGLDMIPMFQAKEEELTQVQNKI